MSEQTGQRIAAALETIAFRLLILMSAVSLMAGAVLGISAHTH